MSTFDKTKPMPKWLTREHANKNTQRGQRYHIQRYYAQPVWADRVAINKVYAEARRRRANGEDVHVDHIFPLCSTELCGLHIHTNLQIIEAQPNRKKSNIEWPGREQLDFFRAEFFELTAQ